MRSWGSRLGALVAMLGLAAAGAQDEQLLTVLSRHYDGRAIEERAACAHPRLVEVTGSEVIAEEMERRVVRVRYRHRDESHGPPSRGAAAGVRCDGSGERVFTLVSRAAAPSRWSG